MEPVGREIELKDVFDSGYQLFLKLELSSHSSSSNEYQNEVKTVKNMLEEATNMVNKIALFSDNEDVDEVATADMKYLLLPALLGSVTLQITDAQRSDILELAEIYFRDFLQRCKSYAITDEVIPEPTDSSKNTSHSDLQSLAQQRENKIARYKRKMQMEKQISELGAVVNKENAEDETKREYYLLLLRKWVETSLEELESIQTEKEILKQMPAAKEANKKTDEAATRKPLNPIIIARNEMQKKVFGLGYPSIPTMTVDEFYQQKYGNECHGPSLSMNSLQQITQDMDRHIREAENEAEEKEKAEERDDPELLRKAREWDDWKDDNRRGSGNRKNMG